MMNVDVTILGAGPYGLAAGAHLRQIKGLDLRVHGEPMDFWNSHMPEGMLLRSPWAASHISDPQTALTMDDYARSLVVKIPTPIPLERFVEYGLWFHRQAAQSAAEVHCASSHLSVPVNFTDTPVNVIR